MAHAMDIASTLRSTPSGSGVTGCAIESGLGTTTMITSTTSWIRGRTA